MKLRLLLALVGTALALATASSPAASAAVFYRDSGSFAREAFLNPSSIAVNSSTGEVLVLDSGAGAIDVYDGGGTAATRIAEFGGGELSSAQAVAVDQANGDVYVSDAGNNRIVRYLRSGGTPPVYTVDSGYAGPAQGSGPGQVGNFAAPIAIDSSTGDLLVADNGNKRVSRYDSSGGFISSFEGADAGGFHTLLGLAGDAAGDVYVVDMLTSELTIEGQSVLEKFAPDGSLVHKEEPIETPSAVAFDSNTGNLVSPGNVQLEFNAFSTFPRLYAFNQDKIIGAAPVAEEVNGSNLIGVAVNEPSGRVYVLTTQTLGFLGVQGVEIFEPVLLPDVAIDPVSDVTATTAELSGSINPVGTASSYRFEYRVTGSEGWSKTTEEEVGSGTSFEAVEADLTGLEPNTAYEAKLVGVNENGELPTTPVRFETEKSAPAAETRPATVQSESQATLFGAVNPFGVETTYRFEYGESAAYGSLVPAQPGLAGHGHASVQVAVGINGLQPATTYHYRLVAENSLGRSFGADRTFTTAIAPSDRAFELVSPAEKGGAAVRSLAGEGFQARPDGDSIVYTMQAALSDAQSSPTVPRVLGTRGSSGWSSESLDPPQLGPVSPGPLGWGTLAVSEDQTQALVGSRKKLTDQAVEGWGNLYVEDLATHNLTLLATDPGLALYLVPGGQFNFLGATSDFSSIGIVLPGELIPGTGVSQGIYVWNQIGGLELASIFPDGHPAVKVQGNGYFSQAPNQMSVDGRRLFMTIEDSTGESGLFRYEAGKVTPISVSHVEGAPKAPHYAEFDGADPSGDEVIFTVGHSDVTPLTSDAPELENNTYMANLKTGTLTYLATLSGPAGTGAPLGVGRNDLSHFYYLVGAVGSEEIWVSDGHEATHIANLGDELLEYATSENGRYFVFVSSTPLTSFDNRSSACAGGDCREVYLYDADQGQLTCVSCRNDGGPATGEASIGHNETSALLSRHWALAVTNAGSVFFDTPDPLAISDTNGARDVYEFASGQANVISGASPNAPAFFVDATPSGSDVFFVSAGRLVPQDKDTANDLYDARRGGVSSGPATSEGSCGGESACRDVVEQPSPLTNGSEAIAGTQRHRKHRCVAKHKKKARSPRSKCKGRHGRAKKRGEKAKTKKHEKGANR